MRAVFHSIGYQPDDFNRLVNFVNRVREPGELFQFPSSVDLEEMLGVMETAKTTRLWLDGGGEMAGYALLETSYNNIWFETDPRQDTRRLEKEMLVWGIRSFRGFKTTGAVEPKTTLDTNCDEQDQSRIELLTTNGFIPQDLMTLHLERSLKEPIPPVLLPAGYTIRPAEGEGEIGDLLELYHAAYGSDHMTREELLSIMRSSVYKREFDLVAVSPQGRIVGLCTCGIDQKRNEKLSRKEGWTDPILVHPDCQGMGLSRALINHGCRVLKSQGIDVAVLGTSSQNTKGVTAFTRAGYRITQRKAWFSHPV
jgi:mycothiol synthase